MFALIAQEIKNPAITKFGAGGSNVAFRDFIVTIWRTAITLGGLALLVMLIIGGLEWVLAGGDKGKVEHARERMTQAVIGMLILMGTVAISAFVGSAFGINLLQPSFENNIQNQTGSTPNIRQSRPF